MAGGVDRAAELARRLFAMHAGRGLEGQIRLFLRTLPVLVDAQPVHMAAQDHLVLADRGHVVLGLAGDDAGVAAHAEVQVDRQAPLWRGLRLVGIEAGRDRPGALGEARLAGGDRADEVGQLGLSHRLHGRERLAPAGRGQITGHPPRRGREPQRIGVIAHLVGQRARQAAAVTKADHDRMTLLPGNDPGGAFDRAPAG